MLIDSHCHLDRENYSDPPDIIITNAMKAGVTHMITVGSGVATKSSQQAHDIAQNNPSVFFACGIHPHEANLATPEIYQEHLQLLQKPKAVALGEIGLDYHYMHSSQQQQIDVFIAQLHQAITYNFPVIIHLREAFEEGYAILKEEYADRPCVIHCFSGSLEEAEKFLSLGFYISIPGIVTFKKAEALQQVAKYIPDDKLLIETDSPYLAPVPYRGKKNQPAYLVETAAYIATLRNQSFHELAAITAQNCITLFNLQL